MQAPACVYQKVSETLSLSYSLFFDKIVQQLSIVPAELFIYA